MNAAANSISPEATRDAVAAALGDKAVSVDLRLGEVTVVVRAANYLEAARALKDAPACAFEQLIDVCGVDYSEYKAGEWDGPRYAVVSHLLSVSLNQRVRLRVFAPDDDLPVVDSLTGLWSSANWFER
ncbi:MAG TPA: NADH-quinone oxidoreductase subunit C, partial [Ramlibacter sp.]